MEVELHGQRSDFETEDFLAWWGVRAGGELPLASHPVIGATEPTPLVSAGAVALGPSWSWLPLLLTLPSVPTQRTFHPFAGPSQLWNHCGAGSLAPRKHHQAPRAPRRRQAQPLRCLCTLLASEGRQACQEALAGAHLGQFTRVLVPCLSSVGTGLPRYTQR